MKKNYSGSIYCILLLFIFEFFSTLQVQAQYCTPTNVGNFNVNYISKVKFGSIDNSSSGTTGGYTYYSAVAATDVTAGQTMTGTISVTMNGWNTNTNTVVFWVNFNENADDDFEDAGERFLFTIKDNNNVGGNKVVNVPISIPIPNNAPAGISRMRVGFRTGDATNFVSCDYNWQAGDIEDYKINIISNATDPVSSEYIPNYCSPSNRGNFNVNYISNVTFGGINNNSSGSTGGYTYYSSVASTDAIVGETISGTVSVTMNGWNTNTNTVVVWVNFNENADDDFNDSGEQFLFTIKDNRNIGGNKIVSVPISIPIPDSAPAGFTMMRVGFRTGTETNFTACDFNYQSGEIEDYKINIVSKKDDDSNYFESPPPSSATLYFNGKDNYVSGDSFLDGLDDVTIMAWVKSDKGNVTDMVIVGEDLGCQLSLKSGNKPVFTITTNGGKEKTVGDCKTCEAINFDEWHHVAGSFSSATGLMTIYVDGVLVENKNVGKKDKPISVSQNANKTFEIGRFSNKSTDEQYFKGNIDEVRVFNVLLTDDQIQQMVYQEIENNSGKVRGVIVKKDIQELAKGNTVSWKNLLAYYPMTDVKDRTIIDYSEYEHNMKLYNLKAVQKQTAPMPYTTAKDGDWTNASTWLYGDVWDIERITNNKDWSIIKIASNVTIENSFKTNGLIINDDKTLTVKGDNLVENNWYLELNGTLDLLNDSQLIQTINSDLVTSAKGKILRRQEGVSNPFWYNYWSSPVGAMSVTNLSDNNASSNNSNSDFRLELLKDAAGFNMQFTSGYTANNSISTYWLYTYKNGVTYYDWAKVTKSTNINPGVGYTQKGSGATGNQQQYIFEGKPNNGIILVDVKDKGGPGSKLSVSATNYLLGNPYPSALDIKKFINDNKGVISGKLQLWQQWSGNSHNLSDYNGGYATVNKLGSVRAYQFAGIYGATNGSQDGTLTPTKYLPVGQGFIVEIIADGKVEFNNNQRVFIKEADADKTYNNGSVFFKNTSSKSESKNDIEKTDEEDEFKKIRLELNSIKGPATKRELLLGFSDVTTDDYDYGYDAENTDINNNDMSLNLEGVDMNMMAYSQITDDKVVPLNFKSSASNSFELKISETENIEESQEIYLKDNFSGTYFNLKEGKAYSFTSEQGKFNERFEIVFQSEQKSLGVEEATLSENVIYYQNSERKLFAKKLNGLVTKLAIVNMLGQITYEINNVSQDQLDNGITVPNVASGAYVAYFRTDTNQVLTKKIVIN